ncbi:MAG: OFA family MFS transporter [Coriobacteriia bacterium]|nr:OFA family MFS transporter [Coriobacteriia bacterium]
MIHRIPTRGWIVVLAGLGINLALGVLYAWSMVARALTTEWGWSAGQSSLPYATAVGTFALSMVFAGRAQDRFGPRIVATIGGLLIGVGLLVASLANANTVWPMVLGFGLLGGAGIGLGYASTTPAAVKWFPPHRKGLITGIVVSGFGLASVYIAPLTSTLISGSGIASTLRILGVGFLIAVVGLSQLLVNPPAGFVPQTNTGAVAVKMGPVCRELDWRDMIKTKQFALLWSMYVFATFAGLMIVGHMAKIAVTQLPSVDLGFGLVAAIGLGNATGRFTAGTAADRFGETKTMFVVFVLQAIMMGVIGLAHTPLTLVPAAAAIGFLLGSDQSLFPSATASYFGMKHLGVNFGLVFTAWGVGGVFGSMTAGMIVDSTGSYSMAYIIAATLSILAAMMTFATKAPGSISTPIEVDTRSRMARIA